METTLHPAVAMLHEIGRRYPVAWRYYAAVLANPPQPWPDWCWCPMAVAVAVVEMHAGHPLEISSVGALAAWRCSQGIYRFDPDMLDALWRTSIKGDLPGDLLHRLPQWCVYIETPGRTALGCEIAGFWAHMEYDVVRKQDELRLLLLTPNQTTVTVPIPLVGTLQEGMERVIATGLKAYPQFTAQDISSEGLDALVSLVLYLCSEAAELGGQPTRAARVIQRGSRPPLLPHAQKPEVYLAGARMGAALRRAYAGGSEAPGASLSGRRRSPIGHMRAAHWHPYWRGSGEARRREVQWLPPIPVNLDDVPEFPVVRPVKRSRRK